MTALLKVDGNGRSKLFVQVLAAVVESQADQYIGQNRHIMDRRSPGEGGTSQWDRRLIDPVYKDTICCMHRSVCALINSPLFLVLQTKRGPSGPIGDWDADRGLRSSAWPSSNESEHRFVQLGSH